MTGCLNGGSCLFDEEKDTFTCSCKLPWTGEDCGVKMGKDPESSIGVNLWDRMLWTPYNKIIAWGRTIKLLPGYSCIYFCKGVRRST